jgi:peptide/nickel transport system substrate-binding protein
VEDVVASLQRAEDTDYYTGRLRFVRNISATEDGALQIDLFHPLENLPLLLDIPIVKAEQVEMPNPLGTGPYVLKGIGVNTYLSRRDDWWCKSRDLALTAKKIHLFHAESTTSIRDAFEFGDVGIVCTDPGSDRYVEYRCDYELWDCETGIFLYLGVNETSDAFQSAEVRRALSKSINRDLLVDQYYQGFAAGTELPVDPDSPYYVATLAQKYGYDPTGAASAMSAVKGQTIRLLVNQNDSFRVKVAQEIGRMLSSNGLIVEVVNASSDEYRYKLRDGNYDLYLGQTRLSPNMDLSAFFSEYGALNYGGIDNPGIYNLCLQALENQGNFYTLYQAIMDEAYLCPVLFRSYAVYGTRGLLTGLTPARDNIFYYSVGKNMEHALIRDPE